MKQSKELTVLYFACILGLIQCQNNGQIGQYWKNFKITYDKDYENSEEHDFRYEIFKENLKQIAEHNVRYENGDESYEVGINQFTDQTHDEFIMENSWYDEHAEKSFSRGERYRFLDADLSATLPSSMNWTAKGGVVGVKNQGKCGACYTFSALGALETQIWMKTNKLISLSEQNLLDCTYNHGCHGGMMSTCYKYVERNGVAAANVYPYEKKKGKCRYLGKLERAANMTQFVIFETNEAHLKNIVAVWGPVTCATNIKSWGFKHYKRGVFYDPYCSKQRRTHSMVIVGYGRENGLDYWLVKNSMGVDWGMDGYIKMARNKDNHCGIATKNILPQL